MFHYHLFCRIFRCWERMGWKFLEFVRTSWNFLETVQASLYLIRTCCKCLDRRVADAED